MKHCIKCGQQNAMEASFCPSCGANQRIREDNSNSVFLIALCTITILGSFSIMIRCFVYVMSSMINGSSIDFRGWIYAGSSIGTFIGAILMLQRKLIGLYIYSISQLTYIIAMIVAICIWSDSFQGANIFASGVAVLSFILPVVFLILYWTNMIHKHLS